jgi:60 kDa SS-A/Ro ribonucleoprotein
VWEALLDKGMPQTALIRQLPRLTKLGLLSPLGGRAGRWPRSWRTRSGCARAAYTRCQRAGGAAHLRVRAQRPRVADLGPVPAIVDALDAGFYAAFGAVEPAGKRIMLALDVSGSMTAPPPACRLSCREASAALALVTAATEPAYEIVGFTSSGSYGATGLTPLAISPRQRLGRRDPVRVQPAVRRHRLLAADAARTGDGQAGRHVRGVHGQRDLGRPVVHPHEALRQYREKTGIDAKLIVVGMTATRFSIADPADPGMLDVAGFDTAVPTLITDFARGI